jgi:transcriptional regulator GlxA family with amidase domain
MDEIEKWNVGILIYKDVDVLDLGGPFEVFSRTRLVPGMESRESQESAPFNVFTVAKTSAPVPLTGDLEVVPNYTFETAPRIDLLVVIGGLGATTTMKDEETLEWIRRTSGEARQTTSVCTGALLLTEAGLLHGHRATTHWAAFDLLASLDSSLRVDREARVVDDQGIICSAGIAAGIDMSFYVVEQLFGKEVADETADFIVYRRNPMTAETVSGSPT